MSGNELQQVQTMLVDVKMTDEVRTLDVSSVLNKCLAFYFPADKNMSRDSTDTEVGCRTDNMICKYVCPSFSIFQLSK